jgi:hypothetical protein
MIIDHAKVAELRESAIRSVKLASYIAAALGAIFIIFGMFVYQFPVPITLASLVLYLGSTAVFGYIDPMTLAKGWIIKILIIAGLFKAVQAAVASERESRLQPTLGEPSLA